MTFNEYCNLLEEIKRNSDVEQYYDELLRPLFKEAIINMPNVKVVPTFDTRYHGNNKTKYDCITGSFDKRVWPDYIFVPESYTHNRPVEPYIKVEFKIPNITMKNGQILYYPIYKTSNKFHDEIESELYDTPLILTDGITWYFLKEPNEINNLKNEEGIERICFIDKLKKYYTGNYVVLFENSESIFSDLKDNICRFIKTSKNYTLINSNEADKV